MSCDEPKLEMITLDQSDLGRTRLFCGCSPTYRTGYTAKMNWLYDRLAEGMRYILLLANGQKVGMIECIPGERAWRGVDAAGYLFIHCFWVIGRNRKRGYGRRMLQECLDQAQGMNGVAVMVSRTHWLPTPRIFLKNGFESVDQASPSFELLVRRLNPLAPLPRFKRAEEEAALGLTLYYSEQCPYFQNMPRIVQQTGEQLGLSVRVVHLDNPQSAQNSPCAYGALGIFLNGELLDYRPRDMQTLLAMIEPKLAGRKG